MTPISADKKRKRSRESYANMDATRKELRKQQMREYNYKRKRQKTISGKANESNTMAHNSHQFRPSSTDIITSSISQVAQLEKTISRNIERNLQISDEHVPQDICEDEISDSDEIDDLTIFPSDFGGGFQGLFEEGSSSNSTIVLPSIGDESNDDPYDFVYHNLPKKYNILRRQPNCRFCKANRFQYEFPTFYCMNGKTSLVLQEVPDALYHPFTTEEPSGVSFRHKIRSYNSHFSFASFGARVDKNLANMSSGVYTFRIHGQIYHFLDQLIPEDEPKYLQLYFYDTKAELDQRMNRTPNLDRDTVQKLMDILSNNPYAQTFRMLRDIPTLDNYRITLNAFVELDQRTYNKPTASQVSAIWVEENGDQTSYKRSIRVYDRNYHAIRINCYHGCYDPLAYPLLFPNGPRVGEALASILGEVFVDGEEDEGFGSRRRRNVSTREYYCYKLQIRDERNLILLAGRLFQQFLDDMYIKIESCRLDYLRLDQKKIRADLYQGIVDSVAAGEVRASWVGKRVVLPASFIGGPRDMQRRYLDAMALVQRYGKPDIFLTMTCNPEWDEITAGLFPGQTAQDRPDLTTRVFRAKLEDLQKFVIKKSFFGEVVAHVYVIEFQKRGLPHAHFLIILKHGHKITNPDQYDKFVCAEIPDQRKYPELHKMVVKHMMHGPCGVLRTSSPCMKNGVCKFRYPRQFNETTVQGKGSYPLYRRRENGRKVHVCGCDLDNRWVAPYNPYLLMRYNCHINVEICSSIKSIKYMYKYVYKGHDCTKVHVGNSEETRTVDEIKMFQDARWVSPLEVAWRIFQFGLSDIKPSVRSLQLHVPDKQIVFYNENDNLEEVQQREELKKTMLT